jgi:hypothetical protein
MAIHAEYFDDIYKHDIRLAVSGRGTVVVWKGLIGHRQFMLQQLQNNGGISGAPASPSPTLETSPSAVPWVGRPMPAPSWTTASPPAALHSLQC